MSLRRYHLRVMLYNRSMSSSSISSSMGGIKARMVVGLLLTEKGDGQV
jgi:hypothetical protein